MSPDDLTFIGHIVDMARVARRLTATASRTDLDTDEKLRLALVRALQILGEAAWRVSDPGKASVPTVPWRQIASFRHRLEDREHRVHTPTDFARTSRCPNSPRDPTTPN